MLENFARNDRTVHARYFAIAAKYHLWLAEKAVVRLAACLLETVFST